MKKKCPIVNVIIVVLMFAGWSHKSESGPSVQTLDKVSGVCGYPDVTILQATEVELAGACRSVNKIVNLFDLHEIKSNPKMILTFKDSVTLLDGEGKPYSLFGYFDSDTNEVMMTHFHASRNFNERKPWGFKWNSQMAESFLLHEVAHLLTIQYLGVREKEISRTWHEAIAYYIQLHLMGPELRDLILKSVSVKDADIFQHPAHVYSMVFRADPEYFAVLAYLSIERWGGMKFLKEVFDGKVQGVADDGFGF